jgi:hypothetical protein
LAPSKTPDPHLKKEKPCSPKIYPRYLHKEYAAIEIPPTSHGAVKWCAGTTVYSIFVQYCIEELNSRGGIFKLLWSPEIDSKDSIPPAYVA